MFKSKKTVLLYIVLLGLVIATVFNWSMSWQNAPEKNEPVMNSEKVKIGLSLGTLKEERWMKDRDMLVAKAKEKGAEIYVQNANNDDDDQLRQVKYLLDKDIDVLIIVPNSPEKSAEAVRLAHKSGVKVISYDRLVVDSNVDLYISFDNNKVGQLMADYLVNRVPEGNYLIMNGARTDNNTKMLKEGYDSVLGDYLADGRINILAEDWSSNWLSESAFRTVDGFLQNETKIDAIIAGNDSLAGAAVEALSEYRLAGKVMVVGQDADLVACQRIVEGTQAMTVYKPINELAETTIDLAIKLAEDQPINVQQGIFDGTYEVPYYSIEPIAVDKENMDDTIIKDGFQSQEDVYRYVKQPAANGN